MSNGAPLNRSGQVDPTSEGRINSRGTLVAALQKTGEILSTGLKAERRAVRRVAPNAFILALFAILALQGRVRLDSVLIPLLFLPLILTCSALLGLPARRRRVREYQEWQILLSAALEEAEGSLTHREAESGPFEILLRAVGEVPRWQSSYHGGRARRDSIELQALLWIPVVVVLWVGIQIIGGLAEFGKGWVAIGLTTAVMTVVCIVYWWFGQRWLAAQSEAVETERKDLQRRIEAIHSEMTRYLEEL